MSRSSSQLAQEDLLVCELVKLQQSPEWRVMRDGLYNLHAPIKETGMGGGSGGGETVASVYAGDKKKKRSSVGGGGGGSRRRDTVKEDGRLQRE